MGLSDEELGRRFGYHPPLDDATKTAHEEVRRVCQEAAERLGELVPAGREQSLVFTHLEDAMMWANAGIARNLSYAPPDS